MWKSWKYTEKISATVGMTAEPIWLLAVRFIPKMFITEPKGFRTVADVNNGDQSFFIIRRTKTHNDFIVF